MQRFGKSIGMVAASSIVGATAVMSAAPAFAAQVIDCSIGATPDPIEGTGPFEFDQGSPYCQGFNVATTIDPSQVTVSRDLTGTGNWVVDADALNQSGPSWQNTQEGTLIAVTAASGTIEVQYFSSTGSASPLVTYTITVGGGGGGGDTPSDDGAADGFLTTFGAHIQQFPLPETGTCDEAEPQGVNWPGVSSGGWGESWSQWMDDGQGGFVCTRTLIYNASTAAWNVE